MTAIAAANFSTTTAVALLLDNAASSTPDSDASTAKPTNSSTSASQRLDSVNLSDHAKATLARARTDRVAADKLAAQVQVTRNPHGQAKTAASSYDRISASFVALAGISEADLAPADEPTVPKVTFTSSLQAFGFSVSATGNADSWSSDIQILGPNGFQAWNTIWGGGKGNPTAGGGGASGLNGRGFTSWNEDGKMYFSISDASATASAVATDDAFASTASAQLHATTFIVDFRTGEISVERTDVSASTALAGVNLVA